MGRELSRIDYFATAPALLFARDSPSRRRKLGGELLEQILPAGSRFGFGRGFEQRLAYGDEGLAPATAAAGTARMLGEGDRHHGFIQVAGAHALMGRRYRRSRRVGE